MLSFEKSDNSIIVSADMNARITLKEDAVDYKGRENLIYQEHNWVFEGWAYFTADEIMGNLSEAPVFINMDESKVRINGQSCQFELIQGDMFFYNEYMIHDFTETLCRGEAVTFQKCG